jgi:hypothetical protein
MYMSYRIEYDCSVGKYEVRRQNNRYYAGLGILAVLLCCLVWPRGREVLVSVMIPGEDAVTAAAFQVMTDDLRTGSGLGQAIMDFCRVVVHGA